MFIQPDHTYRDIQEKSFQQWLYVQYLKDKIKRQKESNQLKIEYMKKLKNSR